MPADNEPSTADTSEAGTVETRREPGERAKAAVAALRTAEQRPGGSKPDPILVADNVVRTFGGLTAVDVEHVEIQRGAITALIGPNGAGKTTFFNLLTGFDKPDSGLWKFNGDDISKLAPHKVARKGMVRTFQLTKSLARMTVLENLRLGASDQKGERLWASILPFLWMEQEAKVTERADELLELFNLVRVRNDYAGSLSGGQRKLLEMARALMVGPDMVMLDEPMAGVNPRLRQSLNEHIRGLREQGMTVVFVEHDMDVVRDVSDWVIVMAQGQVVAEGPPDEVMAQQAVIDAYLGAHHDAPLTLEEEEQQMQEAADVIAKEEEEEGTA
ncbi:branched-chain amino acid transport system ATP-binding protein [Nocardioides daedukensis]|uniref:Branched-chain amino acid transport system ATP-binding protein n=1 Tax=Nocardioides daedukensis TaxID=634462 RepID=A0A7Y9UP71_9ACTN|nr:ABC transporter ATP-binding protein [Nocardioides daedukensis]NYG57927.1 branched-chain amino acid transport system ATP-binding protein [Nocardioides daedukensis]